MTGHTPFSALKRKWPSCGHEAVSVCFQCYIERGATLTTQAETIRQYKGILAQQDARIAADQETIRRLEGEVANWKGDFQLACRQRDEAEQRAEAAEGRVRELEAERAQHVCRVPILPPRRPHIVLPDDATGEGA